MSQSWRPTASLEALRARAALLARARGYFADTGAVEVETPQLSPTPVSDPLLDSVEVRLSGRPVPWFLQTSPEFAMKRLLAAGMGDCFQVCRVFRDGERGRLHLPEFTMIEWYRVGYSLDDMMDDVEGLVRRLSGTAGLPARRLPYREVILQAVGVDGLTGTARELRAALAERKLDVPEDIHEDRDALLDLVMGALAGPALGHDGPVMVHDYPASQASLATLKTVDGMTVAERFELYLGGMEIANGYHELADPAEQRGRFEADAATRRHLGKPAAIDQDLLAALEAGLPACSGVALGFDRLAMHLLGLDRIDRVVSFTID
ncbi:MAG: EF-P lysine aminoacylase EpmA [Steroidobacteraceae bacterium]